MNPAKIQAHSFYLFPFFMKVFILLCLCINLYAQDEEIEFTHFTAEDGLSLNGVNRVLQDSRGFLWFGTFNGLNRYDGYNYKIYLPDPKNPMAISNHSIWALYEDSKGYIWIGTLDGLNRYDWRTEEFRVYRHRRKDVTSLSNNSVNCIYEDKTGNLWIGTNDGLNKYNRDKDNFTVIKKVTDQVNENFSNTVITITEDKQGLLWLGTWNGLTCMKKNSEIVQQYFAEPWDSKNFDYRKVVILFTDYKNNIWIGTNDKGLKKYDFKTKSFVTYTHNEKDPCSLSNDYITAIFEDRDRNIWIGTKIGLNKYNPVNDNFKRIMSDPDKPKSLINNEIFSIYQDKLGLTWVGTTGGVSRFFTANNKFRYISKGKKQTASSLSSDKITSMCIARNGTRWIGTFEGLDEIKPSGEIIHHKHIPGNQNSIADNYVFSVFEDRSGVIWIGTNDAGLTRYNPVTKEFKHYTFDPVDKSTISNNGILSACEDHNGNIWFGTWWGLNRFDRKTESFKKYFYNASDPNSLRNNLIWKVFEDSEGKLWLGTDGGGASRFDPQKEIFTNFTSDTTNPNYISGQRVFDITETNGLIWLGTTDGLNCYNLKTNKTKVYTTEDGLPGLLTGNLQVDRQGNVWIGTDKGLSRFDRKTGSFTNYAKRQGIKVLEFLNNVSEGAADGSLYFGVVNGIMYFHPDSIKDESINAPIVFTDLKVYNQSVSISGEGFLHESITAAKTINIPSSNDVITFEFAFLNYSDTKKNRFRYKLEGFDKEWNDVGSRNNATYTNLSPGRYIFIVKAAYNNAKGNEKTATLIINIVPEFYQTWWFRGAFGLALLFSTVMVFQVRTRSIQKHNKELEQSVRERTKDLDKTINELSLEIIERKKAEEKVQASLKDKEVLLSEKSGLLSEKEVLLKEIHHRVKNNLQVISSLLYLNSKKIKDPEAFSMFQDSQNRVKSIALVHERLYQSKDLGKIDIHDYIKKLTSDLLKSYAINQEIIKLNINVEDVFINIDTAVPCGLIINELISNSLKYAFREFEDENKKGEINIYFKCSRDNEVTLKVTDNGSGIKDDISQKKKNSLGLQLVDSLVLQLEGTLETDFTSGSSFTIKFKI